MKHQMEIEERYFSEDIKSLKLYDGVLPLLMTMETAIE